MGFDKAALIKRFKTWCYETLDRVNYECWITNFECVWDWACAGSELLFFL